MNRRTFDSLISSSDFRGLFVGELGWNKAKGNVRLLPIVIDDTEYQFVCVAGRSGLQVVVADVEEIPNTSTVRRIDAQLRKQAQDYIAIFSLSAAPGHHAWVVPVKNVDKRDLVSVEYDAPSKADFIFQKIDNFTFDPTLVTTIVDVKEAVHGAFRVNSEKITKDFYSGFKKEHNAFAKFISGIDDDVALKDNRNKQWYASVMLNRLMFCYFIQKKGFLDGNVNYLRDKLEWVRREQGEDRFFSSFYKGFLTRLFAGGLNTPKHDREFETMFGRIPYLNGGMFDRHPIERDYADIDICDDAFISLFTFFNKWKWHLDTRVTASGKDINPDVLGYIFEQYINDRAQMGAYYTKEDITEYIGRNTILPFLFDRVLRPDDTWVWQLLAESGDRYIFDAVKQGYTPDWWERIPENIATGLDTSAPRLLERRRDWNNRTPEPWALPTEIWRETIERLQRCDELLAKISSGAIQSVNDFITYNLDIRQFAVDLIGSSKATQSFVYRFYDALRSVTILDPTCGSGAFLFAAMNILEPLYYDCLTALEAIPAEKRMPKVEQSLQEITSKYRSNIHYFIYKSIILRNLYGVDIMQEATEIAKLRLFLKMVAVVDVDYRADNLGLDPLPDIDFNIRCGNTLVGYANETSIERDHGGDMFAKLEFEDKIKGEMDVVARTYKIFKATQLTQEDNIAEFKQAKNELTERLEVLNDTLNHHLHNATATGIPYEKWLASHQPFHWIAEFYQIIHGNGGFDVIIGNPPYVEYSKVRKDYTITGVRCLDSGNLYAFVIERTLSFSHNGTRNGMIIQMSAFCTPRMSSFQKIYFEKAKFSSIAFFDDRPGKLFENLQHIRVVIPIIEVGNPTSLTATTGYIKFYSHCRSFLFQNIAYYLSSSSRKDFSVLKIRSSIENSISEKVWKFSKSIQNFESQIRNNNFVYYGYGYGYFGKILNKKSFFYGENVKESTGDKYYFINDNYDRDVFVGLLNSTLFYWFYINFSDGHNFTKTVIGAMPFEYGTYKPIKVAVEALMTDLDERKGRKICNYKSTGRVEYDEYYPKLSKHFIDEIDKVLAKHYGFTEEELDFIINYDIKYRMGDELNNDTNE